MLTKFCVICGIEKPWSEYDKRHRDKIVTRPQDVDNRCKACLKTIRRKRFQTDKEFSRAYSERTRRNRFIRDYGITVDDYENLLVEQRGLCALCGWPPTAHGKRLAVDHDHTHHDNTRIACKYCIRGLLCMWCNHKYLPWLEKNPHLQNDFVRAYLAGRPFLKLKVVSARA